MFSFLVDYPWDDRITVQTPWGVIIRAMDQKRHPKGSAKGGQFAVEVSGAEGDDLEFPGVVSLVTNKWREHNRSRVRFAKAKKRAKEKYGDVMGDWPEDVRDEVKGMAWAAYNAKKKFKEAQGTALGYGVQVNALGKWTNQKPDKRLLKEAAKVRGQIGEIQARLNEYINGSDDIKQAYDESLAAQREISETLKAKNQILIEAKKRDYPRRLKDWDDQALADEYAKRNNSWIKAQNKLVFANAKANRLKRDAIKRHNEEVVKLLSVDDPIPINLKKGTRYSLLGDLDAPMEKVSGLISARVYPRGDQPEVTINGQSDDRTRAFFSEDDGSIWLSPASKGDQSSSEAHEMGHWVSYHNRAIRYKANQFLKRRAGDEKPVPIYPEIPGLERDDTEIGYRDKFQEPYTGRLYGKEEDAFRMNVTEIISMGVQQMATDPINFANTDPDFFDFTYTILRGG